MTRDEVVREMVAAAKTVQKARYVIQDRPTAAMQAALARAEECGHELLGWRDFVNDPPETNELIIYCQKCQGKRMVGLAYRAKEGGWRDSEGSWRTPLKPQCWMPMPKPYDAGGRDDG